MNRRFYWKLFLIAVVVKAALFFAFAYYLQLSNERQTLKFVFSYSRDYRSYIDPAVNLVDVGACFEQDENKRLYAHKMPGMVPVFAPIYALLGYQYGLVALVMLQFLLDSLCCVLLARIAVWLFRREEVAVPVFIAYLLSSIVSVSTHFAVSELFCTSFGILAVYFFSKASRPSNLWWSGVFAAWAIFFRPTAILVLLALVLLLVFMQRTQIRKAWKLLGLLVLPFCIVESAWIMRNYSVFHRFVPAELSYENFGNPPMKSVFSLLQAMGGDLQSWNENSEMRWFNGPGSVDYDSNFVASYPFPNYLATCGISETQMRFLRTQYLRFENTTLPQHQRDAAGRNTLLIAQCYKNAIKRMAPFQYYIVSPLKTTAQLIFIKRPHGFSFVTNGLAQKLIRLWHFISYYFGILAFLLGVFFYTRNTKLPQVNALIVLIIGHIALYGFVLRYTENRYVVPMYPFMMAVGIGCIMMFFKNRKRPNSIYNDQTRL